jgi:hypothetical protein
MEESVHRGVAPGEGGETGAVLVERVVVELALAQATMDIGGDEAEELPIGVSDQVGVAHTSEVKVVGQVSEDLRTQVESRQLADTGTDALQ